jgi:uncharacterized membrane protein YhaH (DUF805 family)
MVVGNGRAFSFSLQEKTVNPKTTGNTTISNLFNMDVLFIYTFNFSYPTLSLAPGRDHDASRSAMIAVLT